MTLQEANQALNRVDDYLNNSLDTRHPLTNEEIETLITEVDAVREFLGQVTVLAAPALLASARS